MALDPKTKETVREEALRLSKEFAELDGRRPRVLLIEMENDLESDREERKLAANALADSGWDVDVSPSQQPEDAAKSSISRITLPSTIVSMVRWLWCIGLVRM